MKMKGDASKSDPTHSCLSSSAEKSGSPRERIKDDIQGKKHNGKESQPPSDLKPTNDLALIQVLTHLANPVSIKERVDFPEAFPQERDEHRRRTPNPGSSV
jgi:hypothetical protein